MTFFFVCFFRTLLSLAFFSSFATFPNFFSVWLSRMCPWREQPTTDAAAEILPVKVFLIINAGPPYWHNSRLPVDSHYISLTHCHELFSHSHTHPYTGKNNVKATVGIWKYMHSPAWGNMTIAYALKKYHDAVHSAKINPNGVFIM